MHDSPYRWIPLHRRDGSIRAVTLVDTDAFERFGALRWSLSNSGYAFRNVMYREGGKKKYRTILLHREILGLPHGDGHRIVCDHVNRDKLDNRRCNLRAVSNAANAQNRGDRSRAGSRSNYRGVTWDRESNRWRVCVFLGGTRHDGGRYDNELEAARAALTLRARLMEYA